MRIVQYLPVMMLEYGGPVRAIADLSAALVGAGHDVTILTSGETNFANPGAGMSSERSPRVVTLPAITGALNRLSRDALSEAYEVIRSADVVHVHGMWEPSNVQIVKAAQKLGVPHVVSLRGMLDDWPMGQGHLKKRVFLNLFGYEVLETAGFVHCTAEGEYQQSRKWMGRAKGIVIPNLMDLEPYRELPGPEMARREWPMLDRSGEAEPGPKILFLSRVHGKKGVEIFIDMAKQLTGMGIDGRYIVAGWGRDEPYGLEMQSRMRSQGLEDRMKFVGMVHRPTKESLYQACDLFVLPTSQENFGFVFYESLACGTPLLTTYAVDTWPELKSSGGAEIEEQNAESFARAAARMLMDRAGLRAKGEAARVWALREMDPVRIVGMFVRAYEGVLSSRRSVVGVRGEDAAGRMGGA